MRYQSTPTRKFIVFYQPTSSKVLRFRLIPLLNPLRYQLIQFLHIIAACFYLSYIVLFNIYTTFFDRLQTGGGAYFVAFLYLSILCRSWNSCPTSTSASHFNILPNCSNFDENYAFDLGFIKLTNNCKIVTY